jgi:hypothetical protein
LPSFVSRKRGPKSSQAASISVFSHPWRVTIGAARASPMMPHIPMRQRCDKETDRLAANRVRVSCAMAISRQVKLLESSFIMRLTCWRTHAAASVFQGARDRTRWATFLREPISRVLSEYAHAKYDPVRWDYVAPANLTLEQFVTDSRFAAGGSNRMVRMLAGTEKPLSANENPALARAKRRLQRTDWFGVLERLGASMWLLQRAVPSARLVRAMQALTNMERLGGDADGSSRTVQAAFATYAVVSPRVMAAVRAANQLDIELYGFALELLEHRIANASAAAPGPANDNFSQQSSVGGAAPESRVVLSCHVSDTRLAEYARHAVRREAELTELYLGDARSTPPWPRQGSFRSIWDWFPPAIQCSGMLRRIGPLGDGGKWICLDRSLVRAGNAAVVYSIGVSDDVRFEAAAMSTLGVGEVHAFDHTIEHAPPLPPGVQGQLRFERVGLGAVEGGQNTTTLGAPRCTPCLVKSENSPLEKCCPGSPFEPSFSPRRGLLLCSTIR